MMDPQHLLKLARDFAGNPMMVFLCRRLWRLFFSRCIHRSLRRLWWR